MTGFLILPATTAPPTEPFARRHAPAPLKQNYRVYRNCLRWEFGFTCAVCLLHELDFAQYGAEGIGVTQIEHLEPQSIRPDLVANYSNLIYICRFCNGARSDSPVEDDDGRRLLNPAADAWAGHFEVTGDQIKPRQGDRDAEYTEEIYNINDARKVRLREKRRKRLTWLLGLLRDGPDVPLALEKSGPTAAPLLRSVLLGVEEQVRDYAAVPPDAPTTCRCECEDFLRLPPVLASQVQDAGPLLKRVTAKIQELDILISACARIVVRPCS